MLHLYVHLHASHAVLTSNCVAAAPPLAATSSTAKKLGIGIGVPIGILLLSLGVCLVFYIYSRHARRQKASSGLFKGYSKGSCSKSVGVQACALCSLLFALCSLLFALAGCSIILAICLCSGPHFQISFEPSPLVPSGCA